MATIDNLHHKQCKKIAQLTKVIYHLNTRNEDHQSELDTLAYSHQMELQEVVRDAASKIAKFKDLVESKKAAATLEAQLVKFKKQFESDKQQAMLDIEAYKEKAGEREQRLAKEYQAKISKQQDEISSMNGKFQEKLSTLEGLNQDLRKALDATRSSSSAGVDELKRKHEKELSELSSSLTATHTKDKEVMRDDHERALAKALQDLSESLNAESDKALGQIRAQMGGDKQEALMSVRRELEQKLQQQQEESASKLDKLNEEMSGKTTLCDSLGAHKEELTRRLAEAEARMGQEVGGAQRELNSLRDFLASAQEENKVLSARIEEREEQIARLERILKDKGAALAAADKGWNDAKAEVKRLEEALARANQSGASAESELKNKLIVAERDASSLRNEVNNMAATLAQLREEVKTGEKNATKAAADAQKSIAVVGKERDAFQKQLDDAKKAAASLGDKATSEATSLRRKMEEQEADFRRVREGLEEAQKAALEAQRSKHSGELDAAKTGQQQVRDQAAVREGRLVAEMEALRAEGEGRVKAMGEAHKKSVEEIQAKHKAELDELRRTKTELESQMAALSAQTDGERGTLRGEVSKLEGRCTSLQQDLEAKKKEGERAEGVSNGLKAQVEALREELKATQKAYQDKMDMATAKLEADWRGRLERQEREGGVALAAAVSRAEADGEGRLAELRRVHVDEVGRLQAQLDELTRATADRGAQSDALSERLRAELAAAHAAHAAEVAEMTAQREDERARLQAAAQSELGAVREALQRGAAEQADQLARTHGSEVARLRQAEADAQAAHAAALGATLADAAAQLEAAVRAERVRGEAAAVVAFKDQQGQYEGKLAEQERVKEAEKAALSGTIGGLQKNEEALTLQVCEGKGVLAAERADRSQSEQRSAVERDRTQRAHEAAVVEERAEGVRQLASLREQVTMELTQLQQEYRGELGRWEERLQEAAAEYKALEIRWRNRESRPEDTARIQQLEREMVEKDDLVARTREEMIYFKRELLNREENFNSKFSRQPNVGVMQVVKGPEKEKGKEPGGGFGSKSANKPMYTVGANGGSTTSLGVGGLGVGGMSMSSSGVGLGQGMGAQGSMAGKVAGAGAKGVPGSSAKGLL